ncbi:hypothetical protein HDU98_003281 [Podochytrium sp. JEL0797]|nr:hypothetical protein HDU98_003281 [Podochytrium sp. JEL0797]
MAPFTNANFPLDPAGRTYHVGTKGGETANKIITVGDPARARLIAKKHFDSQTVEVASKRGFVTITGTYKGVPVSIVAIGMGISMMDFFVREVRAVVEGPMDIIRFGSCGSISTAAKVGTLAVATEGSIAATRNFDHFTGSVPGSQPYILSQPVRPDAGLSNALLARITESAGKENVATGLNVTADSFYSSQARQDPRFPDENAKLLETIQHAYPTAITLEMESYMLLHLAACSGRQVDGSVDPALRIRAAAATMIFADRLGGAFITPEVTERMEELGGKACLDALVGL